MNKLITATVLIVIFMVVGVPFVLALLLKYVPYNIQPGLAGTQDIYGLITVSQDFVSQKDNLTGVGLSIKNPNLKNKKDLLLELYDNGDNLIRTTVVNGASIEDGDFVKLIFDPVEFSSNKKFKVNLSSRLTGKEDVLQPFYTQENISWMGNIVLDNGIEAEELEGSLAMVTFHKPASKLALVKEIFQGVSTRFFQDKFFSAFYLSTISVLVIILLLPKFPPPR